MSNIGQKYYTIVSNKGKQAVIKALANKELIDLTTMSVGDGKNPIDANWKTLPNEKDKFGITQIKIVDNITLEVTGILSASKGGYMICQAGLYTSDNILFAIAQLPQTAKPVLSDGASKDMTIKFIITIADTSVVNLSIDPNINIITQSRLDEVIELNANELRAEIEDKVDALKQETTANLATLATKADKSVTYTKTEVNNLVNAKANANATVNLTGNQTIQGVKTFTSNITAPNITAMQNNINTINTSLSTVVSNEFTPYLILKSSALGLKNFNLNDGDGQDEINAIIAEAAKYRMFRISINGTVTGNIIFSNINYCEVAFNWQTSAKLIGNLSAQSGSIIRIVNPTLENGQINLGRYSKCFLLSAVNIIAPADRAAIDIGSGSTLFTDQTSGYPPRPLNLTSNTYGIGIDNGSSFIAGRNLTINTTNTTTKINLSRGSFASLSGTALSGDGNDFNIATNTVTASGIIMR